MNENAPYFSASEWLRYTRHVQLPQVGASGQVRLKQSRVLIVGGGGLGSPVSLYLAAAGVGTMTLVDSDHVDVTNLQRQILFTSYDVGQSKASSGVAHLNALNPEIAIIADERGFTIDNADALVSQSDLVLDCTDNFATRYLINDTCSRRKKPWLYASVHQFSGQCALFTPESACFRCVFPEIPKATPDCNAAGVLGVLPGLLGTLQANEALKFLCGLPTPLKNSLMMVDAIDLNFKKIGLARSTDCPVCSKHTPLSELESFYQRVCEKNEYSEPEISAPDFLSMRAKKNTDVIDVRTKEERAAFHIGGRHLPLPELERSLSLFEGDRALLFYCQSGVRSATAVKLFRDNGFIAHGLRGGLKAYLTEI